MKIIFIVELKKRIAGARIFDIIIGKFYYKKRLCPIIIFKVDKDPKIDFYYTILLFDLTVYIWVEDIRKFSLDAKK